MCNASILVEVHSSAIVCRRLQCRTLLDSLDTSRAPPRYRSSFCLIAFVYYRRLRVRVQRWCRVRQLTSKIISMLHLDESREDGARNRHLVHLCRFAAFSVFCRSAQHRDRRSRVALYHRFRRYPSRQCGSARRRRARSDRSSRSSSPSPLPSSTLPVPSPARRSASPPVPVSKPLPAESITATLLRFSTQID